MILSLYFACFLTVDERIGRINGILLSPGKGNLAREMAQVRASTLRRALLPRTGGGSTRLPPETHQFLYNGTLSIPERFGATTSDS